MLIAKKKWKYNAINYGLSMYNTLIRRWKWKYIVIINKYIYILNHQKKEHTNQWNHILKVIILVKNTLINN